MDLKERASYVKGLVDGLDPDFSTKEGRILKEVLSLLGDVCESVMEINDDIDQIYDEIDAIDNDLTDIEEELASGCGCGCGDDEFDDSGIYEITCPQCKEVVCMDEDMLASEDLCCPNCGTKFEVDFSEDDGE